MIAIMVSRTARLSSARRVEKEVDLRSIVVISVGRGIELWVIRN